jgi:hypothetical protein
VWRCRRCSRCSGPFHLAGTIEARDPDVGALSERVVADHRSRAEIHGSKKISRRDDVPVGWDDGDARDRGALIASGIDAPEMRGYNGKAGSDKK